MAAGMLLRLSHCFCCPRMLDMRRCFYDTPRTAPWSLGDRGLRLDRRRRGHAALSRSGCQLLPQFSDFLQQFSLAAVQRGPASLEGEVGGGAFRGGAAVQTHHVGPRLLWGGGGGGSDCWTSSVGPDRTSSCSAGSVRQSSGPTQGPNPRLPLHVCCV